MRILFLALDVDISGRTGDSTHVRELATSFSNVGHDVALIGYLPPESSDQASSFFQNTNVSLYTPESRGDLSTLRFSSHVAREFKPDVIYERRASPKIGVTLGKMMSVPSVVEINAMADEEKRIMNKDEESIGIGRLKKRIRRYFLRTAAGIVAVSNGIRIGLVEEYDISMSKAHVVNNGANTDVFRPEDRSESIEKLGLDKDSSYICFSGNLAAWQGVEHLIAAFPTLADEFKNLRLLIVGDGVLRDELVTMATDLDILESTQFFGRVPYEDVPFYLNSSEICMAPFSGILRNVKYGFSAIKLYEYMGCGRPFITTTVCGIQNEIEQHDVGVVVPPDNPKELANAMRSLLRDEHLREEMGKRGRALAEKEHSWNSVASRITEILKSVTSQRG